MKLIDISLSLSKTTIVYPGNPLFRSKEIKTQTSVISELTLGTHTGTHIDAPRHSLKKGKTIDTLDLSKCIGPCRVLDFAKSKKCITFGDLLPHKIKNGERILAKTSNSKRRFKKFYTDYVYLSSEAAKYLAYKKIVLFGIDYLSVKQRGNPDNRPHTELLKKDIAILEGLDLSRVKPGRYDLIALPLKIIGGDGSPARALLRA